MYPTIEKDRFLIPAAPNAVPRAIAALIVLCEKHSADALICMPSLTNADNTLLNEVWPEDQIRQLARGKRLRIKDRYRVAMCSPFNLRKSDVRNAPVALGLFASRDMIQQLEELLYACRALVILPWMPEDTRAWEKKYKPKVIAEAAS